MSHESAGRREEGSREQELRLYEVMSQRRMHHDQLVWQVPVLSLTAQAFLFTIALGGGSSLAARVISAGLSVAISLMSVHLMLRHRAFELSEARWLDRFERDHGVRAQRDMGPTATGPGPFRMLVAWEAFRLWVFGLVLFGLAAVVVIVLAAVSPATLNA